MIKIDPVTFKEYFSMCADRMVLKGYSNYSEFQFTERNKYVINQLYLHLIGSDRYEGNLNRNILLVGKHGCGKSLIMRAFAETVKFNSRKVVTMHNMNELNENVRELGIEYFYKRPLIMDELGRGEKHIKVYGNDIFPSIQILEARHKFNALTWGIGNFSPEAMEEIYGQYMYERIKEMFDFLILEDQNWRPETPTEIKNEK